MSDQGGTTNHLSSFSVIFKKEGDGLDPTNYKTLQRRSSLVVVVGIVVDGRTDGWPALRASFLYVNNSWRARERERREGGGERKRLLFGKRRGLSAVTRRKENEGRPEVLPVRVWSRVWRNYSGRIRAWERASAYPRHRQTHPLFTSGLHAH